MNVDDIHISLRINGETHRLVCPPQETLLETLRERLDLTGTKHGCELGECGACTVLVEGQPVLSCLLLSVQAQGLRIETIEGVAQHGELHPLQEALAEWGATQCGYCIPGIVLTAKALLDKQDNPSRGDFRDAIAGNLCRCTGYVQILDALQDVAEVQSARK